MNEILLDKLSSAYPDACCELHYSSDFELLVSVILSAQCTDKRVNTVTEKLFKVANTPQAFCDMSQAELQEYIRSCGFFVNKAQNIKRCAEQIVRDFGGVVPSEFDQLITLAGVGRKTANVMLSVAFGKQAIAVDTHVFRVARRLGLSAGNTPDQVESDLCAAFPVDRYRDVHFLFIRHGRDICHSRKPDCESCPISELCATYLQSHGEKATT